MVFPPDCARRRIHGGEPTAGFPDRIEAERSAHVLLPRDVPQLARLLENTAPIHCGRDKQVHWWTECRRAPLEAAKDTRTGVDAFNCRFRVGVSECRERHLVNRLVTFPVASGSRIPPRLVIRAGLHTGNSSSAVRLTALSPSQLPSPCRIARSTSSRAKSTWCMVADSFSSISGYASANRPRRATNHFAAKSGEVLTVIVPERWRCNRRSVPSSSRSKTSRTTAR